jgi:hypothetical protein
MLEQEQSEPKNDGANVDIEMSPSLNQLVSVFGHGFLIVLACVIASRYRPSMATSPLSIRFNVLLRFDSSETRPLLHAQENRHLHRLVPAKPFCHGCDRNQSVAGGFS